MRKVLLWILANPFTNGGITGGVAAWMILEPIRQRYESAIVAGSSLTAVMFAVAMFMLMRWSQGQRNVGV